MQYDYPGSQLFEKVQVIPPAQHNGLGENAGIVTNHPPHKRRHAGTNARLISRPLFTPEQNQTSFPTEKQRPEGPLPEQHELYETPP
jgi:5-deoxy-D-glucuronate isomerase